MRNDEHGAVETVLCHQSFHDHLLRGGIEGRSCLIQQENGSIPAYGARNPKSLTFTAGERIAAFPDEGIEPIGKARDDVSETCDIARTLEESRRHVPHHRDVFTQREIESFGLL